MSRSRILIEPTIPPPDLEPLGDGHEDLQAVLSHTARIGGPGTGRTGPLSHTATSTTDLETRSSIMTGPGAYLRA